MPTWNSDQYMKFSGERTRPAVELAARIAVEAPRNVADLGCGPGNSTAVLANRWPRAAITGVDSSSEMLAAAAAAHPQINWAEADIAAWQPAQSFDVIFSNAAFQWVPDHARLLPRLLGHLAPGGALAFQIPANINAPAHRLMRELAASPAWRSFFPKPAREWHAQSSETYYDILAPHASRVDMWTTEYMHVMDGPHAIAEWYRGTGLRPWLDALPGAPERERYTRDYEQALATAFPARADGKTLFPFLRLFAIAYR